MKKWFSDTDEFYVGYIPQAPTRIAKVVRGIVFFLFAAGILMAGILAWQQQEFSATDFEYGNTTSVEGYLFREPILHLRVPLGKNANREELYQTVLLVGEGKAGADSTVNRLIGRAVKNPEGLKIKLSGFLLYGNGKALLQVNEASNMEIHVSSDRLQPGDQILISRTSLVYGEIVDPKCYFGVMKPGEGKAHRSCAIRCIAGGIPPVFNSGSDYFLLMNERGELFHTEVIEIVGDQIQLSGNVLEWNDWKILQVNSSAITTLSNTKNNQQVLIAMEEGMTLCKK